LAWITGSQIRLVLACGLVFALVNSVPEMLVGVAEGAREAPGTESPESFFPLMAVLIRLFLALFVFGVFLGIILVTEEEPEYARSGPWIRVVCGAMAGAAIAVLVSASWEGAAACASIGGVLGYFGKRWAYHI
jgi:uncharacterized membrane protein